MIIHEYPYNMSYEKLNLYRSYKIKKIKSSDTTKRISLYPWSGDCCNTKDVCVGICVVKPTSR
jgi:hypothetical protein